MTAPPETWWRRPTPLTAAVLAVLAYVPALTAAPGRMPSDSKLYLYLDPGRFLFDAASTFDARQFAGWVPHQHIAYLWPGIPWFWTFDELGVPDWIAHRLWIGTIMVLAGLGVRWCARLLGLGAVAALTAAVVYQLSLYVLPYVSRTSVMLLPWAGLGWIVAFTIRAASRRTWGDPAAIALIVLTVGAVNATALAMIVPAPVLWLVHAAWSRMTTWRQALAAGARIAVGCVTVSLWWIAMLLIQSRHGIDVLPYSESLADVAHTATSAEVWRSLGYWLFYIRDPGGPTTSESLRYLSSTPAIVVSYVLPVLALVAVALARWQHRRYAALLIGVGLVLAVGVHPAADRSPLMRLLTGDAEGGLALALRSSTRALPVMMLGMALALAMVVQASETIRPVRTVPSQWIAGGVVVLVAVMNVPGLWTGAFVDPALDRDQDPPEAWRAAASELDRRDGDRVLQLPGAEFGAFRWGFTVDQPLPGLTDAPLITRDLLPLGSPAAMDLLYAFDDRVQDGTLEPSSVAPVARLLGVDTVWLANDLAFDRFRTARPEVVRDLVLRAPDVGTVSGYGAPFVNRPEVPMTDARSLGDPRVGAPVRPVELASIDDPVGIIRSSAASIVVSGSGDGLVDAAAVGLVAPAVASVRYSASSDDRAGLLDDATALVVTDSNRDRARHWRSSQDTTGFTESGGPAPGVLVAVAADARLPVFDTDDPTTQTVAVQRGPVTATATSYGEPFAYLPEHRPAMAIDGDPATAWLVGEHADPVGERIRLDHAGSPAALTLLQPDMAGARRITRVVVTQSGEPSSRRVVELDERSWTGTGQTIPLQSASATGSIEVTIDAVGGGTPFTASAVAPVGFAEIDLGLGPTIEVVRPPHDALELVDGETPLALTFTRLRVDPTDRWRDDPEPRLVREFDLPTTRSMDVGFDVRVDARAGDAELAAMFGWPAVASSRLAGSIRNAGVSALDGDTETAWITDMDAAAGATLTTTATRPFSQLTVRQPVTGFSRITALTVRVGSDVRTVELAPDASGAAVVQFDPPVAAGDVDIVIDAIEPVDSTDRRFADPVTLPAAITELEFDGRVTAPRIGTTDWSAPCTPLATIGDVALGARLRLTGEAWLAGAAIEAEPCQPSVEVPAGTNALRSLDTDLPITLDRVVLDDRARAALDVLEPGPSVDVVEAGRFHRRIEVSGCVAGCWLVLGEGFNDAWAASGPDGDLGAPTLIDGGFNGWRLPAATGPVVVEVRWTAQRRLDVSLVLSAVAAIAAIVVLVRDRRRGDGAAMPATAAPELVTSDRRPRIPVVAAVLWPALAGILISPSWVLWGALAAAIALAAGRPRLAEWTAAASVLVVSVLVVAREWRSAPLPNGGWPAEFESLHRLGMFAAAALLVAALTADDGGLPIAGAVVQEASRSPADAGPERASP